jgi:uncharacterized protein YndB with AHSA1/START domain
MTLEATASVRVGVNPERAFDIFTGDIGTWWRKGTYYWNHPKTAIRYEFEPGLGGRLLEVYEEGVFEVGTITGWEPGKVLQYTWREEGWEPGQVTTVTVRFTPDGDGTVVDVTHNGWETLGDDAQGSHGGYSQGWVELLGFYESVTV